MKKVFLLIVVIFSVTFFSSCNPDELTLDRIEQLIDQKFQQYFKTLEDQISELTLNQSNYKNQLDQIANSLTSVKNELTDIKENQGDQRILIQSLTSLVTQMMNDIEDMDENILDELEDIYRRLNSFSGDIEDTEEIIEDLLDQIAAGSDHADNELTIRSSNDNPESSPLQVEDDEVSNWYTILAFEIDIDEDSNDLISGKKKLIIHTPGVNVNNVIADMELRIGNNSYDDIDYLINGSSSSAIIIIDTRGESLLFESDEEYEIELLVRFTSASGSNYTSGQTIFAEITSDILDAWDIEDTEGNRLTSSQLQGAAKGNVHTLLTEGAYVEIDIDRNVLTSSAEDDTYEFEIQIEMESINDDIYIPANVFQAFNIKIFGADFEIVFNGTSSIVASTDTVMGSDGKEYYHIQGDEEFIVKILDQPGRGHYFCQVTGYYFTTKDVTKADFSFENNSIYIPINTDDARSSIVFLKN